MVPPRLGGGGRRGRARGDDRGVPPAEGGRTWETSNSATSNCATCETSRSARWTSSSSATGSRGSSPRRSSATLPFQRARALSAANHGPARIPGGREPALISRPIALRLTGRWRAREDFPEPAAVAEGPPSQRSATSGSKGSSLRQLQASTRARQSPAVFSNLPLLWRHVGDGERGALALWRTQRCGRGPRGLGRSDAGTPAGWALSAVRGDGIVGPKYIGLMRRPGCTSGRGLRGRRGPGA